MGNFLSVKRVKKNNELNENNNEADDYIINQKVIINPTDKHTASLIFLHGLGWTGQSTANEFKEFKPNVKYIFGAAPKREVTFNGYKQMNSWFDILAIDSLGVCEDEAGLKESRKLLLDLIEEEMKNGISIERIIIGGFGQGGAVAIYTALTCGYKFAGVLALSTWLPLRDRFPAELEKTPEKFETPILQYHSRPCKYGFYYLRDPLVPETFSVESVNLLQSFGYTDVRYQLHFSFFASEEEINEINDFIAKASS